MTEAVLWGYFGPKMSGKTTLALIHIRRARRQIVFDASGDKALARRRLVIDNFPELVHALRAADPNTPFRICWRGVMEHGPDAFDLGARAALAAENCTVLFDDVDVACGPGRATEWVYKIANAGRHKGVSCLFTARRPAQVNRSFTANADRLCIFRTHEPNDIDYLRQFATGLDPEKIKTLPDHHAMDWRSGAGAEIKKSPFR